MTDFTRLPAELKLLITDYVTDPCDLLALRLTHPVFNDLLSARFSAAFPQSTYMRNNSRRSRDSMLFWIGQHNYPRFFRKLLVGSWPDYAGFCGVRQAAMNAARHGNPNVMYGCIQYVLDTYSNLDSNDLRRECFEVAVAEDQLELAKSLVDRRIRPSWRNDQDYNLLTQAMVKHRPALVEYMLRKDAEEHWNEWDVQEVNDALGQYKDDRINEGTDGWCQRILYTLLKREDLFPSRTLNPVIFAIEQLQIKRRKCHSGCDVWFGKNRKLDSADMVLELRKLLQEDYEWPDDYAFF